MLQEGRGVRLQSALCTMHLLQVDCKQLVNRLEKDESNDGIACSFFRNEPHK